MLIGWDKLDRLVAKICPLAVVIRWICPPAPAASDTGIDNNCCVPLPEKNMHHWVNSQTNLSSWWALNHGQRCWTYATPECTREGCYNSINSSLTNFYQMYIYKWIYLLRLVWGSVVWVVIPDCSVLGVPGLPGWSAVSPPVADPTTAEAGWPGHLCPKQLKNKSLRNIKHLCILPKSHLN